MEQNYFSKNYFDKIMKIELNFIEKVLEERTEKIKKISDNLIEEILYLRKIPWLRKKFIAKERR